MKNRIIYFDYLRVMAIIAVIVLHVSSQNWSILDGRSYEWNVFNFYDSIVRWGVPIFVMISGSLFLSKEVDVLKLYKKNILRMVITYIFWSLCYLLAVGIINNNFSFDNFIVNIISGYYHMWFIPMIIGLYMCVPILKEIVKSKNVSIYFLLISFIFNFLLVFLVNISNNFILGDFSNIINKFSEVINNDMGIHLVLGYSFYFVLGYFMNNIELNKRKRMIIYILGLFGFFLTIFLNAMVAFKTNVPCGIYYDNFSINVFLEVISIHTFFKYKDYKNNKFNKFISSLAKYSFGAYLIHVLIIIILKDIGINTLIISPIISVPLISLLTIIISFLCSWLINKVPIINKWIV